MKNVEFYQAEENSILKRAVQWLADIAVVLCLAWFSVYAFGTQVQISGQSMTPCLQAGDVVLMNRLSYDLGSPDRMDVVVFQREDRRANVKRVIGLPGDTVTIKDGQVYINDSETPLDESYLAEPMQERETIELSVETINSLNVEYSDMEYVSDDMVRVNVNDAVYHVPEGCYFMMGDNRNFSEDARLWQNKYVEKDKIIAKVLFCYFPNIHLVK